MEMVHFFVEDAEKYTKVGKHYRNISRRSISRTHLLSGGGDDMSFD
jgi:hypothetical protein